MDLDHLAQAGFVGFERGEALAAKIVARFHFQPRHLKRQNLVVLVHAPEPVGQPAGAGFEKDDLQFGIALQSAFADQSQAREHLFDRMGNRVGEKPLAGEAVGTGGGEKCAGAFVHQQRHAEIDDGFIERVVVGIVDVAAFYRIGSNKNAFEAELVDDAFALRQWRCFTSCTGTTPTPINLFRSSPQ